MKDGAKAREIRVAGEDDRVRLARGSLRKGLDLRGSKLRVALERRGCSLGDLAPESRSSAEREEGVARRDGMDAVDRDPPERGLQQLPLKTVPVDRARAVRRKRVPRCRDVVPPGLDRGVARLQRTAERFQAPVAARLLKQNDVGGVVLDLIEHRLHAVVSGVHVEAEHPHRGLLAVRESGQGQDEAHQWEHDHESADGLEPEEPRLHPEGAESDDDEWKRAGGIRCAEGRGLPSSPTKHRRRTAASPSRPAATLGRRGPPLAPRAEPISRRASPRASSRLRAAPLHARHLDAATERRRYPFGKRRTSARMGGAGGAVTIVARPRPANVDTLSTGLASGGRPLPGLARKGLED